MSLLTIAKLTPSYCRPDCPCARAASSQNETAEKALLIDLPSLASSFDEMGDETLPEPKAEEKP